MKLETSNYFPDVNDVMLIDSISMSFSTSEHIIINDYTVLLNIDQ